jgi:serine/threonine protein kinase
MRIGRYEVLSELARGGMGGVMLAHDPAGAVVVLKMQASPDDDVRLVDEGRIGRRLSHPSVVETLELIEHQGRPVLVLGYVPGVTLHVCRRLGPLPLPFVVRVFRQVAEALAAIHAVHDDQGRHLHIIHRDVTPANVIVGFDGDARLIDLGIARSSESQADRTAAGLFRGTLRYIAPEILAGEKQSQASDVWALGLCIFEAVLGRRAMGGTEAEVLAAIFQGRTLQLRPSESLPPSLAPVIGAACARDHGQRVSAATVAAMLADVERSLGDTRAATAYMVAEVSRSSAASTTGTQSRLIAEAQAAWGEQVDESGPLPRSPGRADPQATDAFRAPFQEVAPTLVDDEFAMPATMTLKPPSKEQAAATPRPLLNDPWDLPPPITGSEEVEPSVPLPIDLSDDP